MKYVLISVMIILVAAGTAYYVWQKDDNIAANTKPEQTEKLAKVEPTIKAHEPTPEPIESVERVDNVDTNTQTDPLTQFVDLTEKQNQYAQKGLQTSEKIQVLMKQLTPDLEDQPEKVVAILVPLCGKMREYHATFAELIQIIKEKSHLLENNPIISSELFNSEHERMKAEMQFLLESQNQKLNDDKQFYKDLYCDSILAQSDPASTN